MHNSYLQTEHASGWFLHFLQLLAFNFSTRDILVCFVDFSWWVMKVPDNSSQNVSVTQRVFCVGQDFFLKGLLNCFNLCFHNTFSPHLENIKKNNENIRIKNLWLCAEVSEHCRICDCFTSTLSFFSSLLITVHADSKLGVCYCIWSTFVLSNILAFQLV